MIVWSFDMTPLNAFIVLLYCTIIVIPQPFFIDQVIIKKICIWLLLSPKNYSISASTTCPLFSSCHRVIFCFPLDESVSVIARTCVAVLDLWYSHPISEPGWVRGSIICKRPFYALFGQIMTFHKQNYTYCFVARRIVHSRFPTTQKSPPVFRFIEPYENYMDVFCFISHTSGRHRFTIFYI